MYSLLPTFRRSANLLFLSKKYLKYLFFNNFTLPVSFQFTSRSSASLIPLLPLRTITAQYSFDLFFRFLYWNPFTFKKKLDNHPTAREGAGWWWLKLIEIRPLSPPGRVGGILEWWWFSLIARSWLKPLRARSFNATNTDTRDTTELLCKKRNEQKKQRKQSFTTGTRDRVRGLCLCLILDWNLFSPLKNGLAKQAAGCQSRFLFLKQQNQTPSIAVMIEALIEWNKPNKKSIRKMHYALSRLCTTSETRARARLAGATHTRRVKRKKGEPIIYAICLPTLHGRGVRVREKPCCHH